MSSPGVASAATCAVTGRSTAPPGATATVVGAEMLAPGVAVCGWIVADQFPDPPPASVMWTMIVRVAAPAVTSSGPYEREAGFVKTCGSSARGMLIRPAPSSVTAASFVRSVLPQAGPALDINADFTCCGDHVGCFWTSSATAPETCGAAMLVPSNTANGEPAFSGSVDERIIPPGAATSGLRRWPNAVGPA